MGLIPGSGRSPGGGNGNTLQYSCLEEPMDREATTVHGVAKCQTQTERLSKWHKPSSKVPRGEELTSPIAWPRTGCGQAVSLSFWRLD